jgi:hypothetical protein
MDALEHYVLGEQLLAAAGDAQDDERRQSILLSAIGHLLAAQVNLALGPRLVSH